MIHSFSAADPTDPQTIAGRWLSQGAFAYFGAVNEPFLLAFRPPGLVAALLAADVPFVAALRQGELEPFGFPWRLVYLGDPLYRLQKAANAAIVPASDAVQPGNSGRIPPSDWRKMAPDYENWPVAEITARPPGRVEPAQGRVFDSEDDRFRWCLDASIGDLAGPPVRWFDVEDRRQPRCLGPRPSWPDGWRKVLMEIRRDRLDPRLRPFFDELLIDVLEEVGAVDELMARLAQIPPAERGPRVWQAIETGAMHRLARLSDDRDTAEELRPGT